MKARGTSNYEGEDKATEIWNLFFEIIVPSIFVVMICLFTIMDRRKAGHPDKKP